MSTELVDRPSAEVEAWDCMCGRRVAGHFTRCPLCGAPPLDGAFVEITPPPQRVRSLRMAFGVIGLNIVVQIAAFAVVAAGRMEPERAITLSIIVGLVFYAIVLGWSASALATLRPRWLDGNRQTAPVLGIEIGLLAAATLIALLWAVTGEPVIDPAAHALVSEGSVARTAIAFLLIAGVAPFVEEVLFRGVVAESLRRHGGAIAIGVSSFLFALAHLRSLAYYTAAGVVLAVLYRRRGLWASIAAHATFNGCLVVLAVVVALGPSKTFVGDGVSLRAPAGWHVPADGDRPQGAVLALRGPSGATLLVGRNEVSGPVIPSAEEVAGGLNAGVVPMPPGWAVEPGSARVAEYPAGRGVEVRVKVDGHGGVVALIPKGRTLWEVDVATAGSSRAERDLPEILRSVTFPVGED